MWDERERQQFYAKLSSKVWNLHGDQGGHVDQGGHIDQVGNID